MLSAGLDPKCSTYTAKLISLCCHTWLRTFSSSMSYVWVADDSSATHTYRS